MANPEATSLSEARIIQMDWMGGTNLLLGFSNGATVRIPAQRLKALALACAEEIVYADGTTSLRIPL